MSSSSPDGRLARADAVPCCVVTSPPPARGGPFLGCPEAGSLTASLTPFLSVLLTAEAWGPAGGLPAVVAATEEEGFRAPAVAWVGAAVVGLPCVLDCVVVEAGLCCCCCCDCTRCCLLSSAAASAACAASSSLPAH